MIVFALLLVCASHYHVVCVTSGDLSPELQDLNILLATQQVSPAMCSKFVAMVGCILAAYACIRSPAWLDSFFRALSLDQDGLLVERVAGAQRAIFALVVLTFNSQPMWQNLDTNMWLDPSVAPWYSNTGCSPP